MCNIEERKAECKLRKELMGEVSASDTYQKNYLLEAGAGAGKTYTMVNRIINQLLTGQIRPENLVAITFTDKATQEMLSRIDTVINRRLKETEKVEGRDSEQAERIRNLIGELDRMQVSTIHGFCRKLLMTMPYESALGPEFDIVTDTESLSREFIARTLLEDASIFDQALEMTGVRIGVLENSFLEICESGAEIVCEENVESTAGEIESRLKHFARDIFQMIKDFGNPKNYAPRKAEMLEKAQPRFDEIFRLINEGEDAFIAAVYDAIDPFSGYSAFDADDLEHLMPRKTKTQNNKDIVTGDCKRMKDLFAQRIHIRCMPVLRDLVKAYREYKRKNRIASQNDLLIYARDMLRDSAEARAYFHDRYKVIYVDEMQDTDPIQAQILFYLTTDEEHFSADWEKCRPVSGSLFMVGDPKQAIYRFRGADISVYKKLKQLFLEGIGEWKQIGFNYRSSTQMIKSYVDQCFEDRMTGGEYQADYSEMTSIKGSSNHSRIVSYEADKEVDPVCIAAFIAQMISDGVEVGFNDKHHPAKPGDFMIITSTKDATEAYVRELAKYEIPCNMAGAMHFSDSAQISAAIRVVRYLADRNDEIALAAVLTRCYGIELPVLRAYKQRTGSLKVNYRSVQKAFMEEGAVPQEFEPVFAAMSELEELYDAVKTRPAMAVIEEICLRSTAVWGAVQTTEKRDYALITTFLNKLRADGDAGFAELAARAEDIAESKGEKELLLEDDENCVRVMNLHKAKGLEAQIVILANDKNKRAHTVYSHTRYDDGVAKTYRCIMASNGYSSYAAGKPCGWDEYAAEEEAFLEAEKLRLLYVAATRAMTCLIINTKDKGPWSELKIESEKTEIPAETVRQWEKPIRALLTGLCESDAPARKKPVRKIVSAEELEAQLCKKAAGISVREAFYMTPSMLDADMKKPLNTDEPEIPVTESEVYETEYTGVQPYGADWGTIMHRIMELSVKNNAFDEAGMADYVHRAIYETIGDGAGLTRTQQRMLLGGYDPEAGETISEYLEKAAKGAAAFLQNADSELRRLIADKKCYTELPFILRETDMDSDIARAVRSGFENNAGRLIERNNGGSIADMRIIDLNGIIDLALHSGDEWIVVDYKTDSRRANENEEAYIERLKHSYSAQLNAYRSVLEKMGMGTVKRVYICALALSGKLIDID